MRKRPSIQISVPSNVNLPTTVLFPGDAFPFYRIRAINPGTRYQFTIYSDNALSLNAHWIEGLGTIPCLLEFGGPCEFHEKRRKMYVLYVAAYDLLQKEMVIVPLTRTAVASCPEIRGTASLFGRELKMHRQWTSKRSPVQAEITPDKLTRIDPTKKISAEYLRKLLFHIWGIELIPRPGDQLEEQAPPQAEN